MENRIDRRHFLSGLASLSLINCTRSKEPPGANENTAVLPKAFSSVPPAPPVASAQAAPGEVDIVDWEFPDGTARGGAERVLVLIPKARSAQSKFPVLITHHGRGESNRGAEAGAYGWVRDYHLPKALTALAKGQLTKEDFLGIVDSKRLTQHNEALAANPYKGMVIVCPHTPDILVAPRDFVMAEPYTDWLIRDLVPRIRTECPVTDEFGIDGVSLGGRVSLLAGLANPHVFKAVGTLQPAFQVAEAKQLILRAKSFVDTRPNSHIRLLSSTKDFFLEAVNTIHQQFNSAAIPHEHIVIDGPHNYEFNRGPGGIEMLLWHDRVLRA